MSQEKTGRGVDDISTVGRIANETLSQLGDESSVFVTGPTRFVAFDEGELARDMQKLTEQSMTKLKRLGR